MKPERTKDDVFCPHGVSHFDAPCDECLADAPQPMKPDRAQRTAYVCGDAVETHDKARITADKVCRALNIWASVNPPLDPLADIIRAEYQPAEELARLTLQMGAEDLPPLLFDYKRMRELARKFLEE